MDLSEESDATGLPHGTLCQSLIVLARLLIAVTDMGPQRSAKCVPERLSHSAIVHCWPLCSNSWQCRRRNLV